MRVVYPGCRVDILRGAASVRGERGRYAGSLLVDCFLFFFLCGEVWLGISRGRVSGVYVFGGVGGGARGEL